MPREFKGGAEQDGVISILKVSQTIVAEGHFRDFLTDLAHQLIYDAVKKIRSCHTALVNATGDGKPIRVFAVYTDTALCVAIEQTE